MTNHPDIAERLRSIRAIRRLSQDSMAAMAQVSPKTYGLWEKGETEPSASRIVLLANGLNVSTEYLLGRSDHEHGLIPGNWMVDLDSVDEPRAGDAWYARVPRRLRIVSDYEELRKIEDAVNQRRASNSKQPRGPHGDR